MKKFLTFAIALIFSIPLFAATMNYQAVINDANGTPAADRNIGLKFSIVSNGASLYSEEATVKSNASGLVEYAIGSTDENVFSNINWGASGLMLEVGIDINGGTDYTSVYSSSIQSVPSAIYAERSADSEELRTMIKDLQIQTEDLHYLLEAEIDVTKAELYDNIYSLQQNLEDLVNYLEDRTMTLEEEVTDLRYRADEQEARLLNYINDLMTKIDMLDKEINELKNK